MKASVRAFWFDFTVPLEGCVDHFYADVKGLVTVAIGNLVDPVETALGLTMYRMDGVKASRTEIREDWHAVKDNPHAAKLGHRYAARLTRLRMRDSDIRALVLGKLDANEAYLLKRFPDFEDWPADAQLATHSMAWACGPAFRFPRLETALKLQDFKTAAVECFMNEAGNPGLKPRNAHNRTLYRNAHVVRTMAQDPEPLYFPRDMYGEQQDNEPTLAVVVPAREERDQVYVNPDLSFEVQNPTGPKRRA